MAATINVLASIAETLEVLAKELKKFSEDPYFTRFVKEQAFEEVGTPATKQEPKISQEELRDILTTLAAHGKRDGVKQILSSVGVNKFSELTPEQLPIVYEKAIALKEAS